MYHIAFNFGFISGFIAGISVSLVFERSKKSLQ